MTHTFTRKVLKWNFCAKCGLIELRNTASNKAVLKDCPGKRDRIDVRFAYDGAKEGKGQGTANRVWEGLKAQGWKKE